MVDHLIPRISISRAALEFMKSQIARSDLRYETGGILLGQASEDGCSLLVTHATPAGPGAEQCPAMFGIDVEFQQAILDHLNQEYGVDYVGTWHKHPSHLTQPSAGDYATAVSILRDPSYTTDRLVLPIGVLNGNHEAEIFVYHMDRKEELVPAQWDVLDVEVQHDAAIQRAVDSFQTFQKPEEDRSRHAQPAGWATFRQSDVQPREPTRSKSRRALDPSSVPEPCDSGPAMTESESTKEADTELASCSVTAWYQTAAGKARLAQEQALLRKGQLEAEFAMMPDCRIVVLVACEGELDGETVVFTLPANYPDDPPTVFLQRGDDLLPIDFEYPQTDHSPYLAILHRAVTQQLLGSKPQAVATAESGATVRVSMWTLVRRLAVAWAFLGSFLRWLTGPREQSDR